MNSHELKCWPQFFNATWMGKKYFEIRQADRDFKVGDEIVLREYNSILPNPYESNRTIGGVITYLTDFEQKPGFLVIGFREVCRFPDRRLTPR